MASSNSSKIEVNITVAQPDDRQVERLVNAGVEVRSVLKTLGIVSGLVDESRLDDLRKVDGVDIVEPSRKVGLPRPPSKSAPADSSWSSKVR